jgi:DNA ligase-1
MGFRLMLAPQDSPRTNPNFFNLIKYPLLVSPKLDGIRCVVKPKGSVAVAYSRKFLPLRSFQVQEDFTHALHLDGELLAGHPTEPNVYNKTQSHVMSFDKPGDLKFHVFDYCSTEYLDRPFGDRLCKVREEVKKLNERGLSEYCVLEHNLVHNYNDLLELEAQYVEAGYEGLMGRWIGGKYKEGRASMNEGIFFKLKRYEDTEGVLLDVLEGFVNDNAPEIDEQGYVKRSHAREGKTPSGMVGKFVVDFNGTAINVSPGNFTKDQLITILRDKEKYLGKYLKFKYMAYGMKDAPRSANAISFRETSE